MIISKKTHEPVRQNEKNVKKSHKHDVNLQINSMLYFQIGLILCLLATYFFMDMKFFTSEMLVPNHGGENEIEKVFTMNDIEIYKEPVERKVEKAPRKEPRVIGDKIKLVLNNFTRVDPFQKVITQQQNVTNKRVLPAKSYKNPENTNKSVLIDLVEQVPIFPGCEKLSTNAERKTCFSKKISKLIQRKFNTGIGDELGLAGEQTIHVQFKIDKTGNVADIKTNAKYSELEREAIRVVGKIPSMTPGKQQDENVSVMYTLPITFQVFN